MSQRAWLDDKHHRYLAKLRRATNAETQVEICADAASEFQRSTVAWSRTFELMHGWIGEARSRLPAEPRRGLLEIFAPAAAGLVTKSVAYDRHLAGQGEPSRRGAATIEVALELCDLARHHPDSWKIVRAAADAMAHLEAGDLHCDYHLEFSPYEQLAQIARAQLESGSPDSHVLEVYFNTTVEGLEAASERGEGDLLARWEEFRGLVREVDDVEVFAGAYAAGVSTLLRAHRAPSSAWLEREVDLVAGWWFASERWIGVRSKLYASFGTLLHLAIESAERARQKRRCEALYAAYLESLPDWA